MRLTFQIYAILLAIGIPVLVMAQEDAKLAGEAFDKGVEFYDAGQYQQAAEEFRTAILIKFNWKVLYNLAKSETKAGQDEQALQSYKDYLAHGQDRVDDERRAEVESEMERLKANIEEAKGAAVEAPRPASAPHNVTRSPHVPVNFEPDDRPGPPSKLKVGGFVCLGTGGAFGLIGALVGATALKKGLDLHDQYPDQVPYSMRTDVDSVNAMAVAADALIIAGSALVTTGVILLIVNRNQERESSRVSITPIAVPSFAGLSMGGVF